MCSARRLAKRRSKLNACEAEIAELNVKISDLQKGKGNAEIDVKKLEHKERKLEKDMKDAAVAVRPPPRFFSPVHAGLRFVLI